MSLLNRVLGNAQAVHTEQLQEEYGKLLTEDERIELGFLLLRDVFMFTNKRLILVDKQGVRGKKVETMSLPYKSISRFSLETAGTFDLDAEMKLYISSSVEPVVSKKFNKSIDVYQVTRYLSEKVMG